MMAKKKDEVEVEYIPPTTYTDLEARYAAEEAAEKGETVEADETGRRDYAVEGNDTSNYVAVDPSYMTYADDTHKPMRAEEGPEAEAEKRATEGLMSNSVMAATSGSAVMDAAVEPTTSADDAAATRGETEGAAKVESKPAPKSSPAPA